MIFKLPKLRKSQFNTIAECEEDYEELESGHRHISQCYDLYPSNRVNTKELIEITYNTFNVGWIMVEDILVGQWHGYYACWQDSMKVGYFQNI